MAEPREQDRPNLAGVVHRNIDALVKVREEVDNRRSSSERIADAIGRFTGSMWFVYIHATLFALWILINLRIVPIMPVFDPYPFVMLAMAASVEAIFLSTFVLITQNRMAQLGDRRAELDLQINLLAEHEVTQLIEMVEDIRKHLGIQKVPDEQIEELKSDVNPEEVWHQIVKAEEEARKEGPDVL